MIFDFDLVGVTPLIMNFRNIPFEDETAKWMDDPDNRNKSKKGDDRTPPWLWQGKLYNDGKSVVLPQENLMSCLRDAGQKIPNGKSNFKKETQSSLLIQVEFLEFKGTTGKIAMSDVRKLWNDVFPKQKDRVVDLGFTLMVKPARPPGKTAQHVRVRPRFDDWSVRGQIEILDPKIITPERLAQIFEIAGAKIGLGDWRPSAKIAPGPFGRFKTQLSVHKSR